MTSPGEYDIWGMLHLQLDPFVRAEETNYDWTPPPVHVNGCNSSHTKQLKSVVIFIVIPVKNNREFCFKYFLINFTDSDSIQFIKLIAE